MSSPATTSAVNDGDILSIVSEQQRELSMARVLESDLDLAFRLQMQEALTASAAIQSSSSSASSSAAIQPSSSSAAAVAACKSHPAAAETLISGDDESSVVALQSQELDRFEQECRDSEQSVAEMRRIRADLDRLMHDRKFASDIEQVPEDEWEDYGDEIERPYGEGSSVRSEPFRVYFKGLVSEERVGNSKLGLLGIGVAICDGSDNPIFELHKPLWGNDRSRHGAEIKALIEGLNAALTLELKEVTLFCDYFALYQFIVGKWFPKQRKIESLVHQVHLLQRKFELCRPVLVARKDIKFAFKLARDAIVSQFMKSAESSSCRNLIETCVICLEDTAVGQMFTVLGCQHRYCYSCMKQHVEVKLLHGTLPRCLHEACMSELDVGSCGKFLTPKLLEMMKQRIKEAAIPVTEKIYCPHPRCSALMTRTEVTEYAKNALVGDDRSGARKCTKCHGLFCINCKVPWHSNMTCSDYKQLNPFPRGEDAKLKSLATQKLWRQCVKCNHMIELAEGCYHMTCRCGYEFCYTCGAEWKNKQASCSCPLWDEDNIIYDDEEDEGDFDDDEDENDYESESDDDVYW